MASKQHAEIKRLKYAIVNRPVDRRWGRMGFRDSLLAGQIISKLGSIRLKQNYTSNFDHKIRMFLR